MLVGDCVHHEEAEHGQFREGSPRGRFKDELPAWERAPKDPVGTHLPVLGGGAGSSGFRGVADYCVDGEKPEHVGDIGRNRPLSFRVLCRPEQRDDHSRQWPMERQ